MKAILKKVALIATAGAIAIVLSNPASAALYNYQTTISNGIGAVNIAIDTTAKTATWTGANINLVMTDSQLSNFNQNLSNSGVTYTVDSLRGTFKRNGTTYNAFWSSSPKHTKFRLGDNYSFLWMYGRDQNGRIFDFDGKGNSITYTGSTGGSSSSSSSSGSSSGGSSSSSGGSSGVPVPAPGILGLFGLGLAGLTFGRRRKAMKANAA